MFDRVYVAMRKTYFEFRREDWDNHAVFRPLTEWDAFNSVCEQLEIKIELVDRIWPDGISPLSLKRDK